MCWIRQIIHREHALNIQMWGYVQENIVCTFLPVWGRVINWLRTRGILDDKPVLYPSLRPTPISIKLSIWICTVLVCHQSVMLSQSINYPHRTVHPQPQSYKQQHQRQLQQYCLARRARTKDYSNIPKTFELQYILRWKVSESVWKG